MSEKSTLSDFYEEVPDPLADFRNKYGGGIYEKNGKDPFAKDVDVMQAERDRKLQEDQSNMGY
jgi:hypothetical protein